MAPELLSTARPSTLRLLSFAGLAVGGTLLALGALLPWASIPPFDASSTLGVDIWEGWIALVAGLAALVGMLAMRIVSNPPERTGIAAVVLVFALAAAIIASLDATVAKGRFSGAEQRDRLAKEIARETGEPYDDVRRLLERTHDLRFPVETRIGMWLVVLGGIVAAGGAAVSIAWARTPATATPDRGTSSGSPRPPP